MYSMVYGQEPSRTFALQWNMTWEDICHQKELQEWTFAPSLFLPKIPLKTFILAKNILYKNTFFSWYLLEAW